MYHKRNSETTQKMAPKQLGFFLLIIIGLSSTCTATTYTVGDTSGWDISTDLDSWTTDKQFNVGDVLVFQYSSTHSVEKVKKESYQGCNTSNAIESSSSGNTSFTLSQPGDSYFICGNKLHCLGGMKLHVVTTQSISPAVSPVSAPSPNSGTGGGGDSSALPKPSSKSNKPSNVVPSSVSPMFYQVGSYSIGLFGFVVFILTNWIV